MKGLVNYITEKNQASITDLVYEANFHAEDQALNDLDPKMQDVAKFRLLVKDWDTLGEELEIGPEDHYAGKTYEKFEKIYQEDKDHKKEKDKVYEAKKNFDQIWDLDKNDPNYDKNYLKTGVKIYGTYIDALYSWAKKYAIKGKGSNKWIDTGFIAMTFLALGSWIVNYGLKKELQDQLLGKLIKKFDKDMGKLNGVEGLSTFLKLYDEKRASLKRAFETEKATLNSIEELENERKEHKFTIIGGFVEGQGEILFFDNSKFDSFEEIFETKPLKDDGSRYYAWTGYDAKKFLRRMVNSKEIPGCFLCSGYYTFDNKDPENIIPKFGFIDELPKKIYKYSTYDKKFYYRGAPYIGVGVDYGYRFFDSLWSQPKEND